MRTALALLALVLVVQFGEHAAPFLENTNFELDPSLLLPVRGSSTSFKPGAGATLSAGLRLGPVVGLRAYGSYAWLPSLADSPLTMVSGGAGLRLGLGFGDRLSGHLFAGAGPYIATWAGNSGWSWQAKGAIEFAYRLTPALSLKLGASYEHDFGPREAFFQGAGIFLGAGLGLGGLSTSAIRLSPPALDPIFPVFYSWYDKNPLGTITITNAEDGAIRDVKVSFLISQYMSEPKYCAEAAVIERGASLDVPILALLTEDLLKLTESSKSGAEVIVDYSFLGQRRQVRNSSTVRINHRNAMTWDDDRRAAAFVSAKDPAVLRYSKFAAGIVRETAAPPDIDANLRIALGLFEGLGVYGLNYVIDPTTPYTELSASSSAVDFLQYPYQTLVYKGGDCDDLSIMFAAVLESVGIPTALITVPGHIYMAFRLSGEESLLRGSAPAEDLIYLDGKPWAPVEITLFNEGFNRAWQIGAREWREAGDKAAFYPLAEAWKLYEPVGIPGEDTRIVLPEASEIVKAYLLSLDRVVAKELGARIERLKSDYAGRLGDPRYLNGLGILYARYGKIAEAKGELEKAVKAGSKPALANLGNLAFLAKDWRSASEWYRQALQANPASSAAMLGLARARYELGDYAEASRLLSTIGTQAPELARQYAYLAETAPTGGRAASAEAVPRLPWTEE